METQLLKAGGWLLIAVLAVAAIAASADWGFSVHMAIVAAAAMICLWWTLTRADYDAIARGILAKPVDVGRYDD